MTRNSKKKKDKPKESQFKKFVKKRAPIYLGVIALIIVFIVPELTKGDLESSFPESLTQEDREVVDLLMSYKGSNEKGLSVMDAISDRIKEEYPNEKIYDNKKTILEINVFKNDSENYQVLFDFESYKGEIKYDWNVNMETGDIEGNNQESKHIIDLVNFYD